MALLRDFLIETRVFQIEFIKNRLNHALPSILSHVTSENREHIKGSFEIQVGNNYSFDIT